MNLFDNNIINITNIHCINKCITPEEAVSKNKTTTYPTYLKTYELVFFVSSENNVVFNGINITDTVDSIRFLPKGEFDGKYVVKPIRAGLCIIIYFDTSDEMPNIPISCKNMGVLKEKFIKIYNIWNERKPDYYIHAMMTFYDIIRTIKNTQSSYISKKRENSIKKSYEYILKNFRKKDFNYDELCRESGFSSSYFRETFAKVYHATPVQIVTKMRIEYAKELLITGRYSIGEIAEMCGFENAYYFSTVFKKQVGVSPSRYNATTNKE